jgi:hypothetical protein
MPYWFEEPIPWFSRDCVVPLCWRLAPFLPLSSRGVGYSGLASKVMMEINPSILRTFSCTPNMVKSADVGLGRSLAACE